MIVSRYELETIVDIESISTDKLLDKLNSIGLEVESYKKITIPKGVKVGFVQECSKHPDADKLNLCTVDVGASEPLSIVCGASNVAKGQYVAVATIGSELPGGLKIKKTELRGVVSEGMICSSTELGLAKINDGIMVLDESIGALKAGHELAECKLLNEEIIELGITPNRGDCLSLYGVSRDISAAFGVKIKDIEYKEKNENVLGIGRTLQVNIPSKIHTSLQYRMLDIKESKTPLRIALALANNGSLKDNPVENFIEFAVYKTGIILNAYHSDELNFLDEEHKKYQIEVKSKRGKPEEIHGKNRLSLVGYNRERKEALPDSGEFVIEASYVNPALISEAATLAKLPKDKKIYYRSSRGSNPYLELGMNYFMSLVDKYLEASVYSGMHEFMGKEEQATVTVNVKKISAILGKKFTTQNISETLKSLQFKIEGTVDSDTFVVKVPRFRHDISGIQDISEEILRLTGIDNLPAKPLEFQESFREGGAYEEYKKKQYYSYKASMNGFSEVLHYIFTSYELQEKFCDKTVRKEVELSNPITNELATLRTSLIPNMIESVVRNINNAQKSVAFFEIGTVFDQSRNESMKMAFVFSGVDGDENVYDTKPADINFFTFAKKVMLSTSSFELQEGVENISYLHPYQSAHIVNQKSFGYIGRLHPKIENELELPPTFVAEMDFEALGFGLKKAKGFSALQPIQRDLNFTKEPALKYGEIKSCIDGLGISELVEFYPVDLYRGEELKGKESLSIRFILQPEKKAFEDSEIMSMMEKITEALKEKYGLVLR